MTVGVAVAVAKAVAVFFLFLFFFSGDAIRTSQDIKWSPVCGIF